MKMALARWTGILKTARVSGSQRPLFGAMVLGPFVRVDLTGDDPARELVERTVAEIATRVLKEKPN